MPVFGAYSRYYNLLYKDKDYSGEADYLHGLIARYCPEAKSILDLGCGTGRHDIVLATRGYSITGVDMSDEMLAVAAAQVAALNPRPSALSFQRGDIRTLRLGKTFDAVISLFHVMSYQVSNEDLLAAFVTAKTHLNPGGIFIFDFWYGPAVLATRPEVRMKRLEDAEIEVLRTCEPVLYPNDNYVDVNYEMLITEKKTGKVEKLNERHRMRYLFMPEIDDLSRRLGLKKLFSGEWMSERSPGLDTWGVCVGLTNE